VDSSQHLVKVVRVLDHSRYWVLSFVAVAFVIDASRLCSTSFKCSVIESRPFNCCSLAIARTSSKLWIAPNFLSSIDSEPVGHHY